MAFAVDDDDRASGASSENEQDELMEDVDDADADMDAEADANADALEDEEDNDENEEDEQEEMHEGLQSQPEPAGVSNFVGSGEMANAPPYTNGVDPALDPQNSTETPKSPSRAPFPPLPKLRPSVRPEALSASLYDIIPTIAAPQATSINAIAATPDMRYWFTGGSDCYVRKYDGPATINGRTLLTVAQRHPFVDTVTKAGVLMSYWENEDPVIKHGDEPALSPVYSLAVNSEALWLLSGLESGCINLQSVRHDEGKRIASLQKHTSAVSVLTLASDEKSVLSGSWDKSIYDWDLNTGQAKRDFSGSGGQISAIEIRPASSLPVPAESEEPVITNGTFFSNSGNPPGAGSQSRGINEVVSGNNGINGTAGHPEVVEEQAGSPVDTNSLFGDTDSLFGDGDAGAPSGGNYGADDDDEFSRAIGGIDNQHQLEQADTTMSGVQLPPENAESVNAPAVQSLSEPAAAPSDEAQHAMPPPDSNGLPHAEEVERSQHADSQPETQDAVATSDSTFLAAAIDGTLRVWDRRQRDAVARIPNRQGVPPWCMAACWSPDGNYIYAGRRNGTVEEFSLHKGLRAPERTFKFPAGSGAVSAVKAMPNGRHLICASHDILRLYDLKHSEAPKHSTMPFLIVPGPPRAGVISALHVDPTCQYMLSAAGNRGWDGSSTEALIGYEIGVIQ